MELVIQMQNVNPKEEQPQLLVPKDMEFVVFVSRSLQLITYNFNNIAFSLQNLRRDHFREFVILSVWSNQLASKSLSTVNVQVFPRCVQNASGFHSESIFTSDIRSLFVNCPSYF